MNKLYERRRRHNTIAVSLAISATAICAIRGHTAPDCGNGRRNAPPAPSCGLPLEQIEVDGHAHREVTRAIGMQLVAWTAGGAVRDKLRLETAGLRIVGDPVEIDHRVEQSGSADEIVERAASLILLGKAVSGV